MTGTVKFISSTEDVSATLNIDVAPALAGVLISTKIQEPFGLCSDTISAVFTLTNPNYGGSSTNGMSLSVTKEDARATYTGALFVSTSSATSNSATVTLAATIQDITAVNGDPAYERLLHMRK